MFLNFWILTIYPNIKVRFLLFLTVYFKINKTLLASTFIELFEANRVNYVIFFKKISFDIIFTADSFFFQIADMIRLKTIYFFLSILISLLITHLIFLFLFYFYFFFNWYKPFLACEQGYNGKNCGVKCPFPTYGQNCQFKCNCIDKVCDHRNGCNHTKGGKY